MGILTKRQREVLEIMDKLVDDEAGELVYERGRGYIGLEPVAGRTVFALLRLCAIGLEDGSEVGRFERYTINETGRKLLAGDASDGRAVYRLITRRR